MNVREATIEDVPTLVELAGRMKTESTFADMDFDEHICAYTMLDAVKDDTDRWLLLVAESSDGTVVGGFIGAATPSFFGRDHVASELGIYVDSTHRGGFAAAAMLRWYVQWAKDVGCQRINVGNSAGMDDNLFVKLTERLGFQRSGSLMYMQG